MLNTRDAMREKTNARTNEHHNQTHYHSSTTQSGKNGIRQYLVVFRCPTITLSTESKGITFFPHPAKITVHRQSNRKGYKYKIHSGVERVGFHYQDMRGQFVHNATSILKVTYNFTDLEDLKYMLFETAIYCRKDFETTKGKSMKANSIRNQG